MPLQEQLTQDVQDEANRIMNVLTSSGEEDPYPHYAWLREHAPVFWSDRVGAYMLTRYADCERVLKDHSTFRSVDQDVMAEMFPQATIHEAYRILLTAVVAQNPPNHSRLRRLVARDLTPRRVEAMRPKIEGICDELLGAAYTRMRDGEVVDLHQIISVPLPLRVLAELVGVPAADLPELSVMVPRMLHVVDPAATSAEIEDAGKAFGEFGDYLDGLVAERRARPADDLVSALVRAQRSDADDRLTEDELRTMLFALWAAGFETPAIAVDNGVLALLRDPSLARWLSDDARTTTFVDELFRWETPGSISTSRRYATADVDFGGYRVPRLGQIRLLLCSADRDPLVYPEPDVFDPSRIGSQPTSLAFGAGIHFCLGSGLARLEIAVLFRKLAGMLDSLRLADEPVRRRSIPLRDFSSFAVRLAAAAA